MPSNKEQLPLCRCVTCPCTSETGNRGGLCRRCLDQHHVAEEPSGRDLAHKAAEQKSPYVNNPLPRPKKQPKLGNPKTGHMFPRHGKRTPE